MISIESMNHMYTPAKLASQSRHWWFRGIEERECQISLYTPASLTNDCSFKISYVLTHAWIRQDLPLQPEKQTSFSGCQKSNCMLSTGIVEYLCQQLHKEDFGKPHLPEKPDLHYQSCGGKSPTSIGIWGCGSSSGIYSTHNLPLFHRGENLRVMTDGKTFPAVKNSIRMVKARKSFDNLDRNCFLVHLTWPRIQHESFGSFSQLW